jgi:peptidoglycan hydrolase-like protein with peptidoglycan-binding domain
MAKNIGSPVGQNSVNQPVDVMLIQYLLNCVPAGYGGPSVELVVDGIVGPKTLQAIRHFQWVQLRFVDGRVDPDGKTLHALQGFDPYPQEPFNMPVVKMASGPFQGKVGGKTTTEGKYGLPGAKSQGKTTPGGKYALPGAKTSGKMPY